MLFICSAVHQARKKWWWDWTVPTLGNFAYWPNREVLRGNKASHLWQPRAEFGPCDATKKACLAVATDISWQEHAAAAPVEIWPTLCFPSPISSPGKVKEVVAFLYLLSWTLFFFFVCVRASPPSFLPLAKWLSHPLPNIMTCIFFSLFLGKWELLRKG